MQCTPLSLTRWLALLFIAPGVGCRLGGACVFRVSSDACLFACLFCLLWPVGVQPPNGCLDMVLRYGLCRTARSKKKMLWVFVSKQGVYS